MFSFQSLKSLGKYAIKALKLNSLRNKIVMEYSSL